MYVHCGWQLLTCVYRLGLRNFISAFAYCKTPSARLCVFFPVGHEKAISSITEVKSEPRNVSPFQGDRNHIAQCIHTHTHTLDRLPRQSPRFARVPIIRALPQSSRLFPTRYSMYIANRDIRVISREITLAVPSLSSAVRPVHFHLPKESLSAHLYSH